MITVFQVITLQAWGEVFTSVGDATGYAQALPITLSIVLLGSYFATQLFTAILSAKYTVAACMHRMNVTSLTQYTKEFVVGGEGGMDSEMDAEARAYWKRIKEPFRGLVDFRLPGHAAAAKVTAGAPFEGGIMLVIIANSIVMAIDYKGMHARLEKQLETTNSVFAVIFAAEMMLKLVAEGPVKYWLAGWNIMDGVVSVMGVLEILVALFGDGAVSGFGGFAVLRSLRLLRVLRVGKLLKASKSVRGLVRGMLTGLKELRPFLVLVIIIISAFSLVGMTLFGDVEIPNLPHSFDGFLPSVLTLFEMGTFSNYPSVMYGLMTHEQLRISAPIFMIVWVSVAHFILLSLLTAIFIENSTFEQDGEAVGGPVAEHITIASVEGRREGDQGETGLGGDRTTTPSGLPIPLAQDASGFGAGAGLGPKPGAEGGSTRGKSPEEVDAEESTGEESSGEARDATVRMHGADAGANGGTKMSREEGLSAVTVKAEESTREDLSEKESYGLEVIAMRQFLDDVGFDWRPLNREYQGGGDFGSLAKTFTRRAPSSKKLKYKARSAKVVLGPSLSFTERGRSKHKPPIESSSRPSSPSPPSSPAHGLSPRGVGLEVEKPDAGGGEKPNFEEDEKADAGVGEKPNAATRPEPVTDPHEGEAGLAAAAREEGKDTPGIAHRPMQRLKSTFIPMHGFGAAGSAEGKDRLRVSPLLRLVGHVGFEFFIQFHILLSCITLAMDEPNLPESRVKVVKICNYYVTAVFVAEASLFMLAYGVRKYWSSPWNRFDFIVTVFSVMSVIPALEQVRVLRAMRLLRVIRPLRLVRKLQGLRLVLETLSKAMIHVSTCLVIGLCILIMFAILGLKLFKGKLDRPGEVFSFDDIGVAIFTVFKVATLDSWSEVLYPCMEATSPFAALYFIMVTTVLGIIWVSMFTGVLINHYAALVAGGEVTFVTEQQLLLQKAIQLKADQGKEMWRTRDLPSNPVRRFAFRLVAPVWVDSLLVPSLVVMNVILLLAYHEGMSDRGRSVMDGLDSMFAGIFFLEAALKITGVGPSMYFSDRMNSLDFIVMLCSVVGALLHLLGLTFINVAPLRLMRTVRVLKEVRQMRVLLNTFLVALPGVQNICMLFLFVVYIMTIIGMETFGKLPDVGSASRGHSFANFGDSLLTVIQVSTGDNWTRAANAVMIRTESLLLRVFAGLYFVTVQVAVNFILLNMMVAMVLEKFVDSASQEGLLDVKHVFDIASRKMMLDSFVRHLKAKIRRARGEPYDESDLMSHSVTLERRGGVRFGETFTDGK